MDSRFRNQVMKHRVAKGISKGDGEGRSQGISAVKARILTSDSARKA